MKKFLSLIAVVACVAGVAGIAGAQTNPKTKTKTKFTKMKSGFQVVKGAKKPTVIKVKKRKH